jgi:hypothetical protein
MILCNVYRGWIAIVLLLSVAHKQGHAQVRLDPSYQPQLLPQVTHIRDVMPIQDGRAVVVEHWEGGENGGLFYNELACLNADGSRVYNYALIGGVYDILTWNDAAFYLWRGNYPNYVQRFHVANGALDPSFQIATYAWPGRYRIDHLDQVSVDQHGRVYLVGDIDMLNSDQEVVSTRNLVRLDLYGELDTTFTPASAAYLSAAFPMPDGRVLLSGGQVAYNGLPVPRVFMVHDDGSIDPDFSTGFIKANTTCVLPLPDGGLLATGRFINFISLIELDTSHVVKLLPDGSQDPDFDHGLDVYEQAYSGHYTMVYSIVEWDEDRYLISGNFDEVDGHPKRGVAMIDGSGALVTDQCDWPGPGQVDGRVFMMLVKDADGGVFAHGTFDGFDDGVTSQTTQGLVRFEHGQVSTRDVIDDDDELLLLFPVPTNDGVIVRYPGSGGEFIRALALVDAAGRSVREWTAPVRGHEHHLDLQGIVPGTYQMRVMLAGGRVLTRHLIKTP